MSSKRMPVIEMAHSDKMISAIGPDLLRGARAALGWSMMEAARRASVSVSTIVSAEGRGAKLASASSADLDKLRHAYEKAGVRFVEQGAAGRGLQFDIV